MTWTKKSTGFRSNVQRWTKSCQICHRKESRVERTRQFMVLGFQKQDTIFIVTLRNKFHCDNVQVAMSVIKFLAFCYPKTTTSVEDIGGFYQTCIQCGGPQIKKASDITKNTHSVQMCLTMPELGGRKVVLVCSVLDLYYSHELRVSTNARNMRKDDNVKGLSHFSISSFSCTCNTNSP